MSHYEINASRLQGDFEELSRIGSTNNGGVHRPSLSETHLLARTWFGNLIHRDGFELHIDGAGNHFARWVRDRSVASMLIGSHLDSVPYGGRFDGALGVLAALEVLRTLRELNMDLPCNFEAVDFTDEEGTLVGLLGSRALAGTLPMEQLTFPRGGKQALEDGLERSGLTFESIMAARRDPMTILAYLELHIEQGPRLVESGAQIGIVTGIVGIRSYTIRYQGRADHAGTTPMNARRDAGLGLSEFILLAHQKVITDFPDCLINFGSVNYLPGAFNIVPGDASLQLEIRGSDLQELEVLEEALLALALQTSRGRNLVFEYEQHVSLSPTPCSSLIQESIALSCQNLDLSYIKLPSGAGHDAMSLHDMCPIGMIFIPSSGSSHTPTEFAAWKDCLNGANTLLNSCIEVMKKHKILIGMAS